MSLALRNFYWFIYWWFFHFVSPVLFSREEYPLLKRWTLRLAPFIFLSFLLFSVLFCLFALFSPIFKFIFHFFYWFFFSFQLFCNFQELFLLWIFLVYSNESESEVAQLCPTLCNPVGCSPPGSSVHGILQARILECVAISFSRGSSRPRDWTQVSCIGGRHFNLWSTREAHIYSNSTF